MKINKKFLIWFVCVISILIVIPFFIPMRSYLDEVQRAASLKIGVPVTIDSGKLLLLPKPRVVARNITIGRQEELKLAEVSIIPVLNSLFSATKVIELEVAKPVIKKAALDILSSYTSKQSETSGEATALSVKRVLIDEMQFDWPGMKLPLMRLDVHMNDVNVLQSASLETADGVFKADIKPEAEGYSIKLNAQKWTLPVGMPLLVSQAALDMHLKGSRLDIPSIDIALYDGHLNGNALLTWEKDWRVTGKLAVKNLAVKEPSSMVSNTVYLSGKLSGNAAFSSAAREPSALADNLSADFRFDVNNGVLHGLDLVKIASLLTKQGTNGGETQFDEFSGVLNVKGKQYALHDIKISSGLLAANGQVKVKPNKTLDGVVEVELKKGVSLAIIPLQVSGTVDKPMVFPTKAALAGAVAGTAILGPGVGTSLGIKAGGAVDKLKGLFQSK